MLQPSMVGEAVVLCMICTDSLKRTFSLSLGGNHEQSRSNDVHARHALQREHVQAGQVLDAPRGEAVELGAGGDGVRAEVGHEAERARI